MSGADQRFILGRDCRPLRSYHFHNYFYGVSHKFFNLVSCFTSTPINCKNLFWHNTSCIRKPQVISSLKGERGGGGWVSTSCALPLDPPLRGHVFYRYKDLGCFTSTPINCKNLFWHNTSCIRKPQVISSLKGERGGGWAHPAPSP